MKSNIRSNLNTDIADILKEFIDKKVQDIQLHFYTGKIIDNNDPEKKGRCKIRVYGIFEEKIPKNDIPWAMPDFQFVGSSKGSFIVPPMNSLVKVYFEEGDIYRPRYSTKAINTTSLPTQRLSNYPNTLVFFELDGGDYFTINRTTGETVYNQRSGNKITMESNGAFKIENRTGTILEVDSLGNLTIKSGSTNPVSSITIEAGAAGAINIGKLAKIPCPDLPSCLITGGPLAIGTNIPGSQVRVP